MVELDATLFGMTPAFGEVVEIEEVTQAIVLPGDSGGRVTRCEVQVLGHRQWVTAYQVKRTWRRTTEPLQFLHSQCQECGR